MELRVLFTSIKCNFFQKVGFYTKLTHLKGWFFSKRDFWIEKVETNGHLLLNTKQNLFKNYGDNLIIKLLM